MPPRKTVASKPAPRRMRAKQNTADLTARMDELVVTLDQVRDTQKTLSERIGILQAELIETMDQAKVTEHIVNVGTSSRLKAKKQTNSSLVFDEPRLAKRLGAPLWRKVTTQRLDRKKLDAFTASGEVSAIILAECSEEKQSAPFVKIT